ncbi:MAG: tetratricopeptide repeat protein [Sedimentisphaerales bacterium]|nr:tetratricopeptide repeat protein [Sedimentisphaerales bacterium]
MTQQANDARQLLQQALQDHRAGRLDRAERWYKQALDLGCCNGVASYGLGLISISRGKYDLAIDHLNKAIEADPQQAAFYNSLGVALDNAGRHQEAIWAFKQATLLDPDHAEAYNNLAIALSHMARLDEAIDAASKAIRIQPGLAKAHYTLGYCLQQVSRADEAIECYRQAISIDPGLVAAYNHLGVLLCQRGLYEQAIRLLQEAVATAPDYAEAYNNLGIAMAATDRLEQAIACYQEATRLDKAFAEAYYNWAAACVKTKNYDRAVELCKKAIEIRPNYPQAYNQMGIALAAQGLHQEACECYQKAIHMDPGMAEFYNNLAISLKEQARYQEAIIAYHKAIDLDPSVPEFYYNLAGALKDIGELDPAIDLYDKAIAIKGDYPDAQWNKAVALLLKGDLRTGWSLYHWRLKANLDAPLYPYRWDKPRWNGQLLDGKTILVYCEQGLGDAIQFVRYVPMIRGLGPERIILETWPALVRLFGSMEGIDQVAAAHADALADQVDMVVSVMDLPAIFQTDIHTIPNQVPYLHPDQDQVASWKARFSKQDLNVGIVWAGKPTHGNDRNRSCRLEHFLKLLGIPGVKLYSLQKGPAARQMEGLGRPIEDLADQLQDMMDTACCVAALDLVISVDTAVAHLAGALARPVWTLLPFAPDYRWMLGRADSPWYPTMRLFRQDRPRDWDGVFERLASELEGLVRAASVKGSQG